jgi:hypothetical protein
MFGISNKVYIVRCHIQFLGICPNTDILYKCRTKIQKAKNMLDIILTATWVSFSGYLLWYVTSAKRSVTITPEDAKTLWKIHKNSTNCSSHKWRPLLRRGGKIAGFECECGYKYTQKRPIISTAPKNGHRDRKNHASLPVASY